MIKNKDVMIEAKTRNLPQLKKIVDAKFGEIYSISQIDAVSIGVGRIIIDCSCDSCGADYTQSVGRLNSKPKRKELCGKCMSDQAREKMKVTVSQPEYRKNISNRVTNFYRTEVGNELKKIVGNKHSIYLKSRPQEEKDKWTSYLKYCYGEDHHNWNPNKTEFQEYAYKVRLLTEKNYKKHINTINPDNKPRTRCGVLNGYQLDHIISIKEGFDQGLSVERIAEVGNLQMLPWRKNLLKGVKNNVGDLSHGI